jgi:hypothetical protein
MATDALVRSNGIMMFRSTDEVCRFAELIAQSAFVPKDFRGKPGDIMAAIMYGMELGISPMAALQNIAVINGKPSVYGDLLLALCLGHPSTEYIKEATFEDIAKTGVAWCEAKRVNREPVKRTFSVEQAKQARLTEKDIWKAYQARMLMMRARGFTLRDAYADVLKGMISREEAQDIMMDVTPSLIPDTRKIAPHDESESELRATIMDAIMETFTRMVPGHTADDRVRRLDLIREAFMVKGWSGLKPLSLAALQTGYRHLQELLVLPDASEEASEEDVDDLIESIDVDVPMVATISEEKPPLVWATVGQIMVVEQFAHDHGVGAAYAELMRPYDLAVTLKRLGEIRTQVEALAHAQEGR